ncbi:MAG: DUF177 domain-containing protein [Lachnospiraceae bacterium]|nr:DUF177 domain-containing protein [Lachnospiraceae bacterium]
MFLNLTDAFTKEGHTSSTQVTYESDVFSDGLISYEILSKDPIDLKISNLSEGRAHITGRIHMTFQMTCSRCLTEVPYELTTEIDRDVTGPEILTEEEAEDQSFVSEYQLNVEDLINNEIIMSLPMKVLCKPDCKGLCKVCGQNLNLGECGCDTFVPDPRMVAIKDIFNARKEV